MALTRYSFGLAIVSILYRCSVPAHKGDHSSDDDYEPDTGSRLDLDWVRKQVTGSVSFWPESMLESIPDLATGVQRAKDIIHRTACETWEKDLLQNAE